MTMSYYQEYQLRQAIKAIQEEHQYTASNDLAMHVMKEYLDGDIEVRDEVFNNMGGLTLDRLEGMCIEVLGHMGNIHKEGLTSVAMQIALGGVS